MELSCIQFLTAGILGSILAVIFEKPDMGDFAEGIIPLAYAGILSSGVAYTLQVLGQKKTDPAVVSWLHDEGNCDTISSKLCSRSKTFAYTNV